MTCQAAQTNLVKRWPGNVGIAALNTLIIRIIFPTAAVGIALPGEMRSWGISLKTDISKIDEEKN